MIEWLKKRVIERSTWFGIFALAGILGYEIKPELQEQIVTAIGAVVAVIFTVTSDKKRVEVVSNGSQTENRQTGVTGSTEQEGGA